MILAKRFETISGSLRFYSLSATIKKPEEVASRYVGDATCIKMLGGREIDESSVDGSNVESGLSDVIRDVRKENVARATIRFEIQ